MQFKTPDQYHNALRSICAVLRAKHPDYATLSDCIRTYRDLLNALVELDPENEMFRQDLHFMNGKAIGPTWAAMCIDDLMRTRAFVKGLSEAVDSVLRKKSPVHILYAGTGPYAALALPLLAAYSKDEIRISLVEINPLSFAAMQRTFSKLEFNTHVSTFLLADATTLRLPERGYDILMTETMQAGLGKEQQVPILLNLLPQLPDDIILLPQCVDLTLAFLNSNENMHPRYERIGRVFRLTKETVLEFLQSDQMERQLFPGHLTPLPERRPEHFDQLVLLTEIHVYGENHIRFNESGLTVPWILHPLPAQLQTDLSVKTQYVIDGDPGIRFEVLKSSV